MYVLVCYIPETHLQLVKEALFAAGAGAMNGYEQCSWQTLGTGQFKPGEGNSPFIGEVGVLEQVAEWRLELVVDEEHVVSVVQALLESHPYEVPAYHLIPVMTLEGLFQ
ncbi:NGG1p interacting factor NIF3 [uncultured Sphaerochaeta sp.]|uniref:NGG1p interacting factor NIF3 n=1 Tax=uncultured Sphaerochaeta sp. TaxID=886478 RepID=UPI002A0A972C|nr:NGG1p interacting factor NIF3 [uncultured Sphaerochaeta sp.]